MKKKKRLMSFQEYEHTKAQGDASRTEHYAPPEYVIRPAKGDKGFKLMKKAFDKTEKILEPGLWT